jgi:hypothetical protein
LPGSEEDDPSADLHAVVAETFVEAAEQGDVDGLSGATTPGWFLDQSENVAT